MIRNLLRRPRSALEVQPEVRKEKTLDDYVVMPIPAQDIFDLNPNDAVILKEAINRLFSPIGTSSNRSVTKFQYDKGRKLWIPNTTENYYTGCNLICESKYLHLSFAGKNPSAMTINFNRLPRFAFLRSKDGFEVPRGVYFSHSLFEENPWADRYEFAYVRE